jgi:outer membrane receptor protein involved in Fe transport
VYFSGIQGSVSYRTGLSGLGLPGRLDIDSNVLFVRRRLVDITGVAPVRTDGTFGDPKFSGQVNVRYVGEVFSESTSINYVGQQIATRTGLSADLREFNKISPYATVNQSISIDVQKKFRLTMAVTNLFDRIGQEYYGFYPVALLNDLQGRRFSVSVETKF